MNNKALEVLEKYFGYKSFRKGQEQIIAAILEDNDLLGVMPTGGGKLICRFFYTSEAAGEQISGRRRVWQTHQKKKKKVDAA